MVAYEEELGLGVVDEVVNLLGVEFMEDGHGHGTIGEGSKEGNAPTCAIAAADGHFVPFFHTRSLEDDVNFFNNTGHVFIAESLSPVIGQGVQIPVVLNALLKV